MLAYALASLQLEHYITLGGILAPTVTAICTILLTWWLRKIDAKADQAVALAQPTGNGFATDVTAALARIEDRQMRLE